MDFNEVVSQFEKFSKTHPEEYQKIVRQIFGRLKIQKVTSKKEYHYRFHLEKQRYGKGREKYVPLGKISKEDYNIYQKDIDDLCNTGDAESLISQSYFILKEEKSIIQDKITDFFKE